MDRWKLFEDRRGAGRELASALAPWRDESPIVLGLPRGGVPVAAEVADRLGAPLDIWAVRKIGAPAQPELGMGAVAEGGEVFVDPHIVRVVGATRDEIAAIVEAKQREIDERVRRFRRGAPPPDVQGRVVIVVDDGIATGGTARAALRALRRRGPKSLVLAAPVGSADTIASLEAEADAIVCPHAEEDLAAIGLWYEDFTPTTDDDVVAILDAHAHARRPAASPPAEPAAAVAREVAIELDDARLQGDLVVPKRARGIVLFAHGSGSSRKSPRNRFVAERLQRRGLATLLFDLLTEDEEREDARTSELRFDIGLLARRLAATTDWVLARPELRPLAVGYFGASTGAAAALVAAAGRRDVVHAVVSRGGRPDLAGDFLAEVSAPTLLVVGGDDTTVLRLNRAALAQLGTTKKLVVIPGATHLFEEPGALERVAELAGTWFARHLAPRREQAVASP